jgi:hypothetical protein
MAVHKDLVAQCSQLGSGNELEDVRTSLEQYRNDQAWLPERLGLIRRLAALDSDDIRMHEVYATLRKELENDRQWHRYFAAAYSSLRDYSEYRDRKKKADTLYREIAQQSLALVNSIRELRKTGVNIPIEFCGRIGVMSNYDLVYASQIKQMFALDQQGSSPDLVELLYGAAGAAYQADVTFDTEVGIDAAISKQKAIAKTEYIRAFGHSLGQQDTVAFGDFLSVASISQVYVEQFAEKLEEPVTLTPGVRRAMAITTEVALNSDITVSAEDVTKALRVSEDPSTSTLSNLPTQRKI